MRDLRPEANGKRTTSSEPALLIVGHGSRDPRGAEEFQELVSLVRARAPMPVEGGFIELSRPPISECVNNLRESGAREVSAVPLMLLAAGHAKDDVPATLVREKLTHPDLDFHYGRALGIRPELLELMDERISAVVPEEEKEGTAVLIVGRGSSDPDANSDLAKMARLFFEGRPYPLVETAFVSLAPPSVTEALSVAGGSAPGASPSSPTSSSPVSSKSASGNRAGISPKTTPKWRCATRATSGPTRGWRPWSWSATASPSRATSA